MDSSHTQKALDSSNEVTITVTGRKTGREYSTPVWFVGEGKTVFILPGGGSHSQWYKNAVKSKRMKICIENSHQHHPVGGTRLTVERPGASGIL